MPVSHSFRPAWDARRKMGEVQPVQVSSPRPISPSKIPNVRFSLSSISFPTATSTSSLTSTSSFVSPSIISNSSLASHSQAHSCTTPLVSPTLALNDPLDTQTVVFLQASNSSTASLHNSHHRRFSSALHSSFNFSASPTPSSRAPLLESPSHLRPPVSAANRLRAWTTPYARQQRTILETTLPSALVDQAYHTVHDSLAPASRSSYGAGLLRFTQFCDLWSIDEHDRMPASAALLTAFVSQAVGAYSGKTIKSWLAGLRSWHIVNRAPWHGDDEWVSLARVRGNKQGTGFKRPLRAPVSLEHLRVLRTNLDITTPFHAAIWATALTTFFGCRRLGETTVKTLGNFSPLFHVTRTTIVSFRQLSNGSTSASIRIPWTKTTKYEGAVIILTSRDDELCPVTALRNHLTINNNTPSSMSFFAYHNPDGSFSHMLRAHFLGFVSRIWQQSSLDHVLGHSFRIGGAVVLLLAGVPPEVVAATGGWTSLAFLLYWRRIEEIIPLSTSNSYNRSQITSLASILEQFRVRSNIPASALQSE